MANPHIRIKHFTGGPRGEELMRLHFQETSPDNKEFHLFKGKEHIPTKPPELTSDHPFDFFYNDWCWSITDFKISKEKSTGHWLSKSCDDNDDPETGTFQAQAGPGAEGELKKTASGALK